MSDDDEWGDFGDFNSGKVYVVCKSLPPFLYVLEDRQRRVHWEGVKDKC